MNVLNYFCRKFLTLLWMSWGGLWCLEECFGWLGVDRQFSWVCRGRWRYISSEWGGWTFFLGCMGMSGGEWRYILGGWRWVDIYGRCGWVRLVGVMFWMGGDEWIFLWVGGVGWGLVQVHFGWVWRVGIFYGCVGVVGGECWYILSGCRWMDIFMGEWE